MNIFCYASALFFANKKGLFMTFTRSTLLIVCSLASAFAITACSNANNEDKKQTTLTASAPATGEASTLIERNAQQRLSTTLQQHFKTAGRKTRHEPFAGHGYWLLLPDHDVA